MMFFEKTKLVLLINIYFFISCFISCLSIVLYLVYLLFISIMCINNVLIMY